jgi:hypothetical protein
VTGLAGHPLFDAEGRGLCTPGCRRHPLPPAAWLGRARDDGAPPSQSLRGRATSARGRVRARRQVGVVRSCCRRSCLPNQQRAAASSSGPGRGLQDRDNVARTQGEAETVGRASVPGGPRGYSRCGRARGYVPSPPRRSRLARRATVPVEAVTDPCVAAGRRWRGPPAAAGGALTFAFGRRIASGGCCAHRARRRARRSARAARHRRAEVDAAEQLRRPSAGPRREAARGGGRTPWPRWLTLNAS